MKTLPNQSQSTVRALRIAIACMLSGGVWTIVTDLFLKKYAPDLDAGVTFDMIKDVGFNCVLGLVLLVVLRCLFRRWEAEEKQRRVVEVQLERSQRAFQVLSACNGVLVRATSESTLLSDICRVIVELGGCRMAWVGFAQNDARKSVLITESAGGDRGFLDRIGICWDEKVATGRGPTGVAIRSGKVSLSGDSQNDLSLEPWRADVIQQGFACSISLPLLDEAKAFGVLTIYAGEVNAFNPTEVKLLMELAGNLAYGILALRGRIERRRMAETLQQRNRQLEKLCAVAQEINTELEPAKVLRKLVLAGLKLTGARAGLVGPARAGGIEFTEYYRDGSWQSLDPRCVIGGCDPAIGPIQTGCVCHFSLEELALVPAPDPGSGGQNFIHIPVRASRGELLACLQMHQKSGGFDETDIMLLQGAAASAAVALENATVWVQRQQAEEALRSNEAKFSKMFHSSPMPMTVTTVAEGRFVDVNDEFLKILGRSHGEVVGQTSLSLGVWGCPADRDRVVRLFEPTQSVRNVEMEIHSRTGELRKVLWSADAMEVGGERCWLGTALDVTERARAEKALRESEEFVRNVLNSLTAHIAVLNETGTIVAVNQAWCRFAEDNGGTSQSVLAGANYLAVCHAGVGRSSDTLAAAAIKGLREVMQGAKDTFELEYPCHSNEVDRWFLMRVWPLKGSGKGVVVAHEDISQRKQAEQQINLQLSALTTAANAIVITDRQGRIEWVNPAFTLVSGYSAAEAIGRTPRILKSGEHKPDLYATMWSRISAGEVWSGELVNHRKGGQKYYEETTITPVKNAEGQIAHFVAIKQDVTERRQLEDQLRQSQKLEAIGLLAGGVAHDFNNILSALLMQIELFDLVDGLPQEIRDGIKQMRDDTVRATALTRQLLMFSRRQVMQTCNLDLSEIVRNMAKMLRRIIREDVRLELDLCQTPLPTQADTGMIEQVLLNLAVNARDAMPKGGELRITTTERMIEEGTMPNLNKGGRFNCLRVSDTGTGIPADVLPRIFEPFFTTKEAGKGTGLGLATVFGIVKQHRGWVEVQSEVGKGTSFLVYLPLSDVEDRESVPSNKPTTKSKGQNETILLVEDEPRLRKILSLMLEKSGYSVISASSGADALHRWPELNQRVSLLLTDLVMPGGIGGQELGRRLKAEQPELRIVYMSGYSEEIGGRGLELSQDEAFLQKPFQSHELLNVTRRSLEN